VTGAICPFPSLCFAECAGYTEDDVVDCDELEFFGCLECLDEDLDPVCVTDSTGNVFPVPNECFADCLGLVIVDDEDCGTGFSGGDPTGINVDPYGFTFTPEDEPTDVSFDRQQLPTGTIEVLGLYPNPASELVNLGIKSNSPVQSTINIFNAQGQLVLSATEQIEKGDNLIKIEISQLESGIYYLNSTSINLANKRFIKL